MPLDFKCSRCGKPIIEPGAIVLSAPLSERAAAVVDVVAMERKPSPHSVLVWKDHVCDECQSAVLDI